MVADGRGKSVLERLGGSSFPVLGLGGACLNERIVKTKEVSRVMESSGTIRPLCLS